MACLDIKVGSFSPLGGWLSGTMNANTANGATVENSAATGLKVSKNGITKSIINTSNKTHFLVFGTPQNYVLGCLFDAGLASVIVYEITGTGITEHFLGGVSSSQLPIVSQSVGNGNLFLIAYHNAPSNVIPIIYKSENGELLLSAGNFQPNNTISADAVDTVALPKKLRILDGVMQVALGSWPLGRSAAIPLTLDFPDVVIGAAVPLALTKQTLQGRIKNTGVDCFTISSVSNNAPFSIVAGTYSKTMPVQLLPGDTLTFDVIFDPGTIAGTPFTKDLTINPAPSQGDVKIIAKGRARPPHLNISITAPAFGTVSVGNSVTKNLVITNDDGEVSINLISFPLATSPDFSWVVPPLPVAIPYLGSLSIPISFTPSVDAVFSKAISIISSANGSPHTITLQGTGCVPKAIINFSSSIIDLGSIQKGFRTVRMFKVRNTGDGNLQFDAQIEAAVPGNINSAVDASLFGILEDDTSPVISPASSFSNKIIRPQVACGALATGTGEYVFGICFFAGDALMTPMPRTANAVLRIFNHNDTTAGTASSFLINLTAQVINPVSVDVELVIDRSGSMSEASGSRIKIDTALDAARLFVELSRPDVEDRIGLVRFNNSPEVIPSYGIQFIIAANHASIKNQLNAGNYTPAGATSIAGGVIVAENNIGANARATPPPALNKIILVLTDGKDNSPYTNPADGQTYSLLGGFNWFPPSVTLPLPVPTDIKIYSIGIGDNIDIGRLAQLASSTGGAFLQVKTFSGNDYFNLEKQFTQVYMEAVNYAPISDPVFTILAGETHYFEFEVLAGDKSAMVVVYDREGIRLPFWIISPLGEIVDLLSVPAGFQIRPGTSPTARFIEINMPQHEPERYAGTWKIEIKHEGRACISGREEANKVIAGNLYGSGFQPTHCKPFDQPIMYGIAIGVGSNFNMISYVTPSIVKTGEPILLTALVSEFGLPVKGCTINIEARRPDGNVSHHILYDDGRHQDDDSDDGTYAFSYSLTSQEGIYTFKFNSTGKSRDGKTISRELVRSKYVEGRIPLVEPVPGFSDSKDECCSATSKWVRIGIVLLFIILIFVFLIWKSLRG